MRRKQKSEKRRNREPGTFLFLVVAVFPDEADGEQQGEDDANGEAVAVTFIGILRIVGAKINDQNFADDQRKEHREKKIKQFNFWFGLIRLRRIHRL